MSRPQARRPRRQRAQQRAFDDEALLDRLLRDVDPLGVPVLVGLLPLEVRATLTQLVMFAEVTTAPPTTAGEPAKVFNPCHSPALSGICA